MHIKETFFAMSDGVRLYTAIVLPAENKKFPIVFIRTPYEETRNGEPYPVKNSNYGVIWRNMTKIYIDKGDDYGNF